MKIQTMLNKAWCGIWCFFIDIGYARAASALSREGRYEEARNLILMRKDCECGIRENGIHWN